ncbi:MAG: twin-arginine translocase subunit TatC [Firmicutes bacterium]|nr:twin-arginine translocase subunit TatC [Bacillota bacterium]
MPVEGHLEELRRRLITSAVALLPIFVALFLVYRPVLHLIQDSGRPYIPHLVALSPQEAFFTYMKVDFFLSAVIASPLWLYQALAFFLPAFSRRARILILRLLPTMILLFLAGVAFGLRVLLPLVLRFLVGFGADVVVPDFTLGNYTSFLLGLTLPPGLLFEMPVVAYGLAAGGIVTADMLRRGWRYAVLGAAVLAAIFAPPGPFPMLALGLPILALYEASIVVAAVTERRLARRRAQAAEEGAAP